MYVHEQVHPWTSQDMKGLFFSTQVHTSDEDVGRVGLIATLGGDAQRVQPLILLVQVCQGNGGPVATPVHVGPLGGRQENVW